MSGATIHVGDCREVLRTFPAESVHCAVTSPPYWGLRDYGVAGQLGLEATPEEYVARMVGVFREVRRVLRPDGTLWLNMGDCYATGAGKVGDCLGGGEQGERWTGPVTQPNRLPIHGLKPKDLVGMPWRLAFALQADGWWLRSDIIWSKPNLMPESITDRPTKAHEYIFLLTRSERYYYDAEAIREGGSKSSAARYAYAFSGAPDGFAKPDGSERLCPAGKRETDGRRNKRTVWTIPTAPFRGAHFATFPPALVEPCVKAGTSERGACPACGAPWRREVEKRATGPFRDRSSGGLGTAIRRKPHGLEPVNGVFQEGVVYRTVGWAPTCACPAAEPVPCVVLDPFAGTGTVGLVACGLGRDFVGIELNPEYAEMARRRIVNEAKGALVGGVEPASLAPDDLPLFGEACP